MTDGFALRRGGFRAPRVPFDLRCVLLAAAGFLAVSGLDWVLGNIWDMSSPVARMFGLVTKQIAAIPFIGAAFYKAMNGLWGVAGGMDLRLYGGPMAWWQTAITAVCFAAIWSLFGSALMRTAALRLTRDEPIDRKSVV